MAFALGLIHLFAGRLRFLDGVPRSRWLSLAGGVSVAYVFVHILPDLSSNQATIQRYAGTGVLTQHAYLAALVGVVFFYALERAARGRSAGEGGGSSESDERSGEAPPTGALFWVHIGSFALYNALIGYLLLHREVPGLTSLVLYFVAMALHFVVNDYGLRQVHKDAYHTARWYLAAAAVLGWAIGALTVVHEAAIAVLFAFLAGGVVLNVLKEELPKERQSRIMPFLAGAAAYAALLVVIG